MYNYDAIFIGSGHAGRHGAVTLAAAGKKVAVLDHDLPGGTCTDYGCDAKILLNWPFEFVEGLSRYQDVCVDQIGPPADERASLVIGESRAEVFNRLEITRKRSHRIGEH